MRRRPPLGRLLRAGVLCMVAAGALSTVAGTAAWARSNSGGAATAAAPRTTEGGGEVPCPPGDSGDTCFAMPVPRCVTDGSTSGKPCPIVAAGPITDLGAGQFVYLRYAGFSPGDVGVTEYFCSALAPLPAPADYKDEPQCATSAYGSSFNEVPQQVPIFPNGSTVVQGGTAESSMQVASVSPPSDPISSAQSALAPGGGNLAGAGFYCDTAVDQNGNPTHPCALVVSDDTINGSSVSTTANSIMIPLSFEPASSGCPQGTVVSTESEFGIELLMPTVARLSCRSDPASAVVPFETATDGLSAIADLTQGTQEIAFTDDPEDPTQQALLSKGGYALIPVALSANVVAFFSDINFAGHNYDLDQMELSPTMAAGLLMSAPDDSTAALADGKQACSGPSAGTTDTTGACLGLVKGSGLGQGPCFSNATCSLYNQLNYINGFNTFTNYAAVQRSDASGPTFAEFNWFCGAPQVGLGFGVDPKDPTTAAQEFENGLGGAKGPAPKTCPAGADQVPPIPNAGGGLITVNDPSQQALKAIQEVQLNSDNTEAAAGFADMNWAEARYYGMSVAALQNAGGQFTLPTAASLDAALADASTNPDGSLTFRNLSSDPASYVMPDVIYAVVPTTPVDGPVASAVRTLLSQLLDLTAGTDSSDLPQGFVPLPTTIGAQASQDVAKDVVAISLPPSSASSAGGGSSSSATNASTGSGAVRGSDLAQMTNGVPALGPAHAVVADSTSATTASRSTTGTATAPLGPFLPLYALVSGQGDTTEIVAEGIGLTGLLCGAVMIGAATLRRRSSLQAAHSSSADGAGGGR
ncbi:MAG: hypothetical protein ACYDD4_09305 [Acidimicrobiales bacterium]